ncbi:hypothetical protein MYX76_10570 [Desulfobacterota bacterium AH_259_B03_O07]|nr:hypothetical protein [Desulfobacterota bacterium AH_259_B03_O07]
MKKRNRRINTLRDLRRLVADTLNGVLLDDIPLQKVSQIAQLSSVMLKILIATEFENRITKAEEVLRLQEFKNEHPAPLVSDIRSNIYKLQNPDSNFKEKLDNE